MARGYRGTLDFTGSQNAQLCYGRLLGMVNNDSPMLKTRCSTAFAQVVAGPCLPKSNKALSKRDDRLFYENGYGFIE